MPEIGQTISHYKILEKIGGEGMGEVCLADDTTLDRCRSRAKEFAKENHLLVDYRGQMILESLVKENWKKKSFNRYTGELWKAEH